MVASSQYSGNWLLDRVGVGWWWKQNRYMEWAKEGTIRGKLEREQLAITTQLRSYRTNYLHKPLPPTATQPFLRFARQLTLLLTSHCNNIVLVAPEKVAGLLEEWGGVVEDVLAKYYQLSLKVQEGSEPHGEAHREARGGSEVCVVCGQQMKKVEVERMRRQLLKEADLHQLGEPQHPPPSDDQDLSFFAEVSELLSRRQGELLRNQLSMGLYQEEALAALASLLALKDSFALAPVPPPTSAWQLAATEEIKTHLQNGFQDKIPPWIRKLLDAFQRAGERGREGRAVEAGVQTGAGQAEVLEMRRKVMVAKERAEKWGQRVASQERELAGLADEKKELEIRVDYYRSELSKLIQEIEQIKTENQLIRIKLSRTFPEDNPSSLDLRPSPSPSRSNINATPKRKPLLPSLEKPTGKRPSQNNSKDKRDSQTSISFLNQPPTERPSKRHDKTSGITQPNSQIEEITHNINSESKPTIDRHEPKREELKREELGRESRVIEEEEGQNCLQEEKKKIEEVSTQLREIVRNIQAPNHSLTSPPPLTSNPPLTSHPSQAKDRLKRVARKTSSQITASPDKGCSGTQMADALGLIYLHLKEQGLLVQINEQEFKASLLNIKDLNLKVLVSPELTSFMQSGRIVQQSAIVRNQRLSVTRRQWNERTYHMESQARPISQQQLDQYFSLFRNQENAYHYECSLTKNHLKGSYRMSTLEENACSAFYSLVEQIKRADFEHYKFICSYLRYPFQLMHNGFGLLDVVNDMSHQNFHHYFQRILAIHTKCNRLQDTALCEHLQEVRSKLKEKVGDCQR